LDGVENYGIKKAQVLTEGDDGVFVSAGPTLFKALQAAKTLAENGEKITVINSPCINDADIDTIAKYVNKSKKLLTVEDHQLIGGLGAQITHKLKQVGSEFKLASLGVDGVFGQSAYTADELYIKNGLDEKAIIEAFNNL
jgi:transketolase